MDSATKFCKKCHKGKLLSEFHKGAKGSQGRKGQCKKCIKKWHKAHNAQPAVKALRQKNHAARKARPEAQMIDWNNRLVKTYNITSDQYIQMLSAQNNLCGLCKQPERSVTKNGTVMKLSVDHDHSCCAGSKSCGQCVRGLLCQGCNARMGYIDALYLVDIDIEEYRDQHLLIPSFEVLG